MNIHNPTVSVFMMAYNHEKYIAQALDSVLMQNVNFNYDIVIGEDCSTDNTRSILLSYKEKHPDKIKLLLHEKNIGAAKNQIEVFKNCTGKYIALCEGDDYWIDPLKLQKQVDFLEVNPKYSLSFHNALILWEDKSQSPRYFCKKNQKEVSTVEDVIEEWFIPSASMVFRKEYVMPVPDWYKEVHNGDYALHLILANKGKLGYIDKVMSVYRKTPGSLSYNPKITIEYLIKKKIKLFNFFNLDTELKYDKQIKNQIDQLKKRLIFNKLDLFGRFMYYSRNPINNFGNALIKLGKKMLKENKKSPIKY